MKVFGFPIIDLIVIALYFIVVIWIGMRSLKRIRNSSDFFLAGRSFGKVIQTFAAFGQGTSSETAVGTTTMVATNGAAGLGLSLVQGVVLMPILWMVTPWYRRMRYMSMASFFAERFGSQRMAGFYAISQTILFMIVAAGSFTAMSKTVAAIAQKPDSVLTQEEHAERALALELRELKDLDYRLLSEDQQIRMDELSRLSPNLHFSYINRTYLTIVLAVIVLVYAVSGGLEAAFITDMIQGIFILFLTVMLVPFGMAKINEVYGKSGFLGAFEAFHENLPQELFKIFGSPNVPQFTWYFIVFFGLLALANTAAQANQFTAAASAKDDETARVGFTLGIFMKRYSNVIWGLIAMITLLLYGNQVTDPDLVWGIATRDLLPVGLVGLMVACLMAALMSTADALMLTSSSLLANDFYKPMFPEKSDRHYIMVGRIFGGVYIVGAVVIAQALDDVFSLFIFMLGFNSVVAAAFWMGMVWRRTTRTAAWASMGITLLFTLLLPVFMPFIPGVRKSEFLAQQTQGYAVENTYIAKTIDVEKRKNEIFVWDELNTKEQAEGERPVELMLGDSFVKHDYVQPHSIFWQSGISVNEENEIVGGGMLKVELVLLQCLGFDLTQNKHAFNETLTAVFRLVVPFGLIVLLSFLTRPQSQACLDFFYARMRTPVSPDHDQDEIEVELTRQNPARFDHLRLFPHSNWEFRKWNVRDWKGQLYIVFAAGGIGVLLYLLVTIGR